MKIIFSLQNLRRSPLCVLFLLQN